MNARIAVSSRLAVCVVALSLLAACSPGRSGPEPHIAQASPSTPGPSTASPAPATSPTRSPLPDRFVGTISRLPAGLARRMRGTTWHPGCPVPLSALRLLTLRYWGFDHRVHAGRMVVNATVARAIVSVFRRIFAARFPIKQMHLAVEYKPSNDDPNDTRDYTVGFNCRPTVTAYGPGTSWSNHAYGLAVDINPMENPYVTASGYVHNNHARPYRDRSLNRPGMIRPGDAVVRAFEAIGWHWGGSWSHDKDYMHFSWNGR